jgi:hypothetical protein
MKLSYRGIHFEGNPAVVEANEGQTIGKYRGAELHTQTPKKRISIVPHTNLKYRGASY